MSRVSVLVEIKASSKEDGFHRAIRLMEEKGFVWDKEYDSISMPKDEATIIRGTIETEKITDLESVNDVAAVKIWSDPGIASFR